MGVLVDTNILLRAAQPSHPSSAKANSVVSTLLRRNESLFFCFQTVAEFWNVATRPANVNGLGFSQDEVLREVKQIEAVLEFLPDSPEIYVEWKRIVEDYGVQGVKVYDARLVALANVYKIGSILTFNSSDFKRYGSIKVIDARSDTI